MSTTDVRTNPAAPVGVFVGLTVLDVVHRVTALPGRNEKITALSQFLAAGGPAANAAVIFAALGGSRNREIAEFFSRLAALLSSAQTCTVGYACRQALAQTQGLSLSSAARGTILSLFDSLGRYDLEGSVQALDLALSRLREEAKALQNSAAARCRTYLTLGVCTGLAAAVILI